MLGGGARPLLTLRPEEREQPHEPSGPIGQGQPGFNADPMRIARVQPPAERLTADLGSRPAGNRRYMLSCLGHPTPPSTEDRTVVPG
jgi:hypothetical protein